MFWLENITSEIIKSGKYQPYWIDDMKTPSGRIHFGSLRGVVIHDLLYKGLITQGKKANFSYCINDVDPMDGFPVYLDKEKFYKYMGCPLFKIPSPEQGFDSFSQYYAQEFIKVFNKIGCHPKIIWTSDLYAEGKFDELIKICLDKTDKIREIFKKQYPSFTGENYYPYQPICSQCGKISTTKINKWDGEFVYYQCVVDAVNYTQGCGFTGKVKPIKQNGKMPWKIEWAAHWKTLGITIEWAGKDHMTQGGSYEVAVKISQEIFHYPVPYAKLYEHLLVGGKKMSSSKGHGVSSREMTKVLPAEILRFFFIKTHYRQTIEFDPYNNMVIPDLFDEYDKCWQAYNNNSDKNLARIFELSQIKDLPQRNPKLFIPRFRDIANYIQLANINITDKFRKQKKSALSDQELTILNNRIDFAKIWLVVYAPDEYKNQMQKYIPEAAKNLTADQKAFLQKVIIPVEQSKSAERLQAALYDLAKQLKMDIKKAFAAIYLIFIGREYGPRAGWFLCQYTKEEVIKRIKEAIETNQDLGINISNVNFIDRPDLFTVDPEVRKKYPSVSVGIAVIKNVQISKINDELEKEKQELLNQLSGINNEKINSFAEVISYRKLYKETGVDWHSKRPSPEALLRRISKGKELYAVNTCVDAYNLTVIKNRVSVGAFDFDQVKFPTILRFAGEGDEILLLGDETPTKYSAKEIAYYDQQGGYNIDFNYRDAQRTMVTGTTKNLLINVEGVYDISPRQVEFVLKSAVEKIIKYCGGKVEVMGVIR